VQRKETLSGELKLSAQLVVDALFKITLRITNPTPSANPKDSTRDTWLMQSLVSTHAILQVVRGECLSLVDPPAEARDRAESCTQAGLWPVLVGNLSDRDALLASPIILYDYPQIAPESAGDFCDGTEIDEMLALRIMTMTDAEKLEMREGDEHGRRMLERTEALSDEHMMRLHGVLRGLRSIDNEGVR
jgi:hydrogenase maturation protease